MAESTDVSVLTAGHQFVSEEGQLFNCRDCPAKCCRLPWQVDVMAEEREKLLATTWVADYLKERDLDFLPKGDDFYTPRIRHANGDYSCVFLDDNNLCVIQSREGHDMLPVTCQAYPFSPFVADYPGEDEEGAVKLYAATSYFCPSIARNYGNPMETLLEEKYNTFQGSRKAQRLPENIKIGGISLGKKSYLALSDALERLFEREDFSVSQALWQGRRLIWRVVTAGYDQRDLSPDGIGDIVAAFFSEPESRETPEAPSGTLAGRAVVAIDLLHVVLYELIQEKAEAGARSLNLPFIKMLLDLINKKGTYRVWNLKRPVDFEAAARIRIDEDDPVFQYEMRRYYRHLFFNKRLFLRGPDFLKTYFLVGTSYAKAMRVARWMAWADGAETPDRAHLQEAIGYADVRLSSSQQDDNELLARLQQFVYDALSTREESFMRVMLSESDE